MIAPKHLDSLDIFTDVETAIWALTEALLWQLIFCLFFFQQGNQWAAQSSVSAADGRGPRNLCGGSNEGTCWPCRGGSGSGDDSRCWHTQGGSLRTKVGAQNARI